MKHFFILNPASGPVDATSKVIEEIKKIFLNREDEYEIYLTKKPKDSFVIANEKSMNLEEDTIFYACGGDGTCFDVVNGIAGKPHAFFANYPIGSCNDFLKSFPNVNFKNLEELVNGTLEDIDICKVNEYYSLNEVNIGFDARVNDDCNNSKYKAKNVRKAYNLAILKNFIKMKKQQIRITFDDKIIYDNKSLLLVAANGQFYGGKYNCAPLAKFNDGLIDLVVVNKVGRIKFIKLISKYEKGLHLNNPKFEKLIFYKQVKNLKIESNEDMVVCIDGEIFHWKEVVIENIKHGIKMLMPRKIADA